MRDIKYRCWDANKKILSDVWEIGFKAWDGHASQINKIVLEDDGTYEVDNLNTAVLMQFTGVLSR